MTQRDAATGKQAEVISNKEIRSFKVLIRWADSPMCRTFEHHERRLGHYLGPWMLTLWPQQIATAEEHKHRPRSFHSWHCHSSLMFSQALSESAICTGSETERDLNSFQCRAVHSCLMPRSASRNHLVCKRLCGKCLRQWRYRGDRFKEAGGSPKPGSPAFKSQSGHLLRCSGHNTVPEPPPFCSTVEREPETYLFIHKMTFIWTTEQRMLWVNASSILPRMVRNHPSLHRSIGEQLITYNVYLRALGFNSVTKGWYGMSWASWVNNTLLVPWGLQKGIR